MAGIETSPPFTLPSTLDQLVYLTNSISPKLNEGNYLTWKAQVLPLINGYNLSRYITDAPPSKTIQTAIGQITNPGFEPWNRQDQLILGWLRSSLTDTLQGQMVSCKTVVELWTSVQQEFSVSSCACLSDLKCQLQTATKGASSCKEYLHRMRKIADDLSFIGSPVHDEDLVMATLNGLGPDFNSITVVINTRSNPVAFTQFSGMLLSHKNLLLNQNLLPQVSPSLLPHPTALYTRYPQPGNSRQYQNRPPRPTINQNRPLLPNPGPRHAYYPTSGQSRGPQPHQQRGPRPQVASGSKPTC